MSTTFTRAFALDDITIRAGGDGRTVEAYAAVFDTPARISSWEGEFDEQIARGAFNRTPGLVRTPDFALRFSDFVINGIQADDHTFKGGPIMGSGVFMPEFASAISDPETGYVVKLAQAQTNAITVTTALQRQVEDLKAKAAEDEARLRATPDAERCIDCQSALEEA